MWWKSLRFLSWFRHKTIVSYLMVWCLILVLWFLVLNFFIGPVPVVLISPYGSFPFNFVPTAAVPAGTRELDGLDLFMVYVYYITKNIGFYKIMRRMGYQIEVGRNNLFLGIPKVHFTTRYTEAHLLKLLCSLKYI